jgi:transglutaminase-like putative cysteine protease
MGNYLPQQLVRPVGLTPSHQSTETDRHGNVIAKFQFRNVIPGAFAELQAIDAVQVYPISYRIDPSNVPQYDVTQDLYREYTSPQRLIESDSEEIKAKAAEVTGSETNPYLKARKVYDFVKSYLSSEENHEEYGALWALRNGKGDCSEFSKLFVAMCRASSLPSRVVHGYAESSQGKRGGHGWAEVYFQNCGWIPADPMFGKTGKEYFGSIDNTHITVAKGLSVASWNWTYSYVKDRKPAPISNSTFTFEARPLGQDKSSISCFVSKGQVKLGELVNVSGFVSPPHAGAPVILTYGKPSGFTFTRITLSSADGAFVDAYAPDVPGEWSVSASWYIRPAGNETQDQELGELLAKAEAHLK